MIHMLRLIIVDIPMLMLVLWIPAIVIVSFLPEPYAGVLRQAVSWYTAWSLPAFFIIRPIWDWFDGERPPVLR
ncbi:MAG: hypothetical protein WC117_01090 [Sphaerochaetaceae bacterium]